ncbi:acetolactate synthase small subunit [Petrotoga sp. 9PWA.NaAc.5.4]|uniref:acetolactate synthase small subunit n=1 Tax=Petrotoga sp. 9PWA.NaAc.5.4 TaxID=1434328 RepID=UPI000CA8222F|nr:acetolactate synthase small subunit [Petrotoga sp. 9PWA.NaAc.5.4]PNR92768.1 acetolactate synthase [Petrotoga sp. 9PWA.NaAc.5.4]
MRHILSVTVSNQPAVLARISGLFSRRNFNILSLNVGETDKPEFSRMTIVVEGNDDTIEQVKKQLYKLIDVIKITDLNQTNMVERDMALIKVNCNKNQRSQVIQVVDVFRGKIVDFSIETVTVEVTGDENKITAFIEILKDFGIKEIVRTGIIALDRELSVS